MQSTAPGSAEQNDWQVALFSMERQPASRLTVKLTRPRSRGALRLVDPNPHSQADIGLNLAADPEDERRLADGVRLVLALANTPAMAAQHTGLMTLDDGQTLSIAEASAALGTTAAAAGRARQRVRVGRAGLVDGVARAATVVRGGRAGALMAAP